MPKLGRHMVIGAKLGLIAGVVLPLICSLLGSTALQLRIIVPGWIALAAPAFSIAGAIVGALLWQTKRVSNPVSRLICCGLFIMWLCVLFAFVGNFSPAGYKIGSVVVLTVLIIGAASFAMLRVLSRMLMHRHARRLVTTILAAATATWTVSVGLLVVSDICCSFPPTVRLPWSEQPNVLLIVLDTVRADHMSCYGCPRKTTPNIDALAAEAHLYRNVMSPSPWTLPSHASFFTGLPSSGHRCNNVRMFLDDSFDTLAELLKAAGYQTAGFSSNSGITREKGFAQGFNIYKTPCSDIIHKWPLHGVDNRAEMDAKSYATLMHNELKKWFAEDYHPDKPFFLFLNYYEPHIPYVPPSHQLQWASEEIFEKWRMIDQYKSWYNHILQGEDTLSTQDIMELEALYDDEITYVDSKVGEVLDLLRKTDNYEDTLIIITSDHGEHFGEHHLMEHQFSLYEPLLKVPLIMKYRDRFPAGNSNMLVQSHDIYPTILELVGVRWKRLPLQNCRNLLRPDRSESRLGIAEYWRVKWAAITFDEWLDQEGVVSESSMSERLPAFFMRDLKAFQTGDMKMIQSSRGESELYDIVKDPAELQNLFYHQPDIAKDFDEQIEQWWQPFEGYNPSFLETDADRKLSDTEIETMRGLGYIR